MKTESVSYSLPLLASIYAIVILMQFQLDIPMTVTPLRISASDFLVPLFILFTLYVAPREIFKQDWKIKWLPVWFIAFTCWMGISLLIGYLEAGFLSKWALGNKFFGWLLLIGYFLAGGYTKNLTNEMLMRTFRVLFITNWIVCIFSAVSWATRFYLYYPSLSIGVNNSHRFMGFLQNPNAFGLFNVVLLLLLIAISSQKRLFSRWLTLFGYTISLASIIGSGSRGAFIAGIFGLTALLLRKIISFHFAILITTTGIGILLGFLALNKIFLTKVYSYMYYFSPWKFLDTGVSERLYHIKLTSIWWLENPLMGIGLGSYLNRQLEQNMDPISTIHQTPLWLLTEMGLIGLILMLIFFYAALKSLYKASLSPKHGALAAGGLAVMVACLFDSLTSEIMYQRYLWFFLGMFLVQKTKEQRAKGKQGM